MKYVEFGIKRDTVWVMGASFEEVIVRALTLRGFSDVRLRESPEPSGEGTSPWNEVRYLDQPYDEHGLPNKPEIVHVIRCRTKPLNQSNPIAASTSQDVARKVVEAIGFTSPSWNTEIEEMGHPE